MTLGRCPERACPFRWRDGADRLCRAHWQRHHGTGAETYHELLRASVRRETKAARALDARRDQIDAFDRSLDRNGRPRVLVGA